MSTNSSSHPFPRRSFFRIRTPLLTGAYATVAAASLYLAYELRFDFQVPENHQDERLFNLLWVVPFKLVLLALAGQFGSLLSYFRIPDLSRLGGALLLSSVCILLAREAFEAIIRIPRGVILADLVLSAMMFGGFRVALRVARERSFIAPDRKEIRRKRVAIVGAGEVGSSLAVDFLAKRGLGMRPVVFFDDNPEKLRRSIHEIPVAGPPEDMLRVKDKYAFDEIIIAMPSATHRRMREVIDLARQANMPVNTVPSLDQLATGRVKADRVRPVAIEDLLGRDPVDLDDDRIDALVQDKVVLVTGAGGSIGSELCRQIVQRLPQRLLMLDQSEFALFEIEQELIREGAGGLVLAKIGSVTDRERMRYVFSNYKPEIVFHAAAHKHVPMMERHPGEALKNNTGGTVEVAELAAEFGVEKFIFISTDKAINPTSVMGTTKRLAELYVQAKQGENGHGCRYLAVRFGNVLGSSGSVIPIFRRQIARGGPVTVTHPEVTRYFMTVSEAVGLVLQCAVQGQGGEIFVLDMNTPVKIADLARQMIELSGFEPDVDIEIEFTGLRPGEKLFEELQHHDERHEATEHPRIRRFVGDARSIAEIRQALESLRSIYGTIPHNEFKHRLKEVVPEYEPFLE